MVAADGSRGWPQPLRRYKYDLQQARFSRHLWGQSFSEHHMYTDSRGGWAGPSTTAKQSRMESRGGRKSTTGLLLHPVHTSMNSSLAFDVHSRRPLTASTSRRQNIFSDLALGGERKQHLPLPWSRCHLRQGCFHVLAPSSSWSAAHRVLEWSSAKPSRACLISCSGPSVQVCAGRSASPLRWTGREPGTHTETKQKGQEERQRVMKRSAAPRLPKEISRRVSLTILVPATTAAVGSPAPCSL